MSGTIDAAGEPIPTSAVLMAAAKHIAARCRAENVAFIKCKKKDPNPEKCLDKGRQVTSCVLNLEQLFVNLQLFVQPSKVLVFILPLFSLTHVRCSLKELHQKCPNEMDAYAGCMYYYTNEFDLCRKEQEAFEKACPVSE
ncbi:unnamed protein product [Musa acuminata subsp. malaccensis]|uniref:(wild Malaysian banana) hypothetical protein n=1 Tax=Musa acuminata subsp. malaccensis TaxID=214687 RepID=A0A8D7ABR1_MUSAM|nr:unnamed protein product [Musa acuminata subsp. malaccensis]